MLLINIAGLCVIAFIVWWFWLYNGSYKPKTAKGGSNKLIVVVENGVYHPARLFLNKGEAQSITFLRKDETPCAETLLIPELGISESLPINKSVSIIIPATESGDYAFHCQMNMYKGVITINAG